MLPGSVLGACAERYPPRHRRRRGHGAGAVTAPGRPGLAGGCLGYQPGVGRVLGAVFVAAVAVLDR
ncbi:MAG: hypothetical protein AB7Q92_12735, partial [Acidimicrobiia bacterium]